VFFFWFLLFFIFFFSSSAYSSYISLSSDIFLRFEVPEFITGHIKNSYKTKQNNSVLGVENLIRLGRSLVLFILQLVEAASRQDRAKGRGQLGSRNEKKKEETIDYENP
jgi:hypothetical protein